MAPEASTTATLQLPPTALLGQVGGGGGGEPLSFKFPSPQEVSLPQPPKEGPILEVEEMELQPVVESPKAPAPIYSGYEKHFLPTPEELGLLSPPAPRF